MSNFNLLLDNPIIFYGMFTAVACHLGFSFLNSYLHSSENSSQTSVSENSSQTSDSENSSQTSISEDGLNQITQNSSTSINTQTPNLSPVKEINGGSQGESSTADEVFEAVIDNVDPNTIINLEGHPDVIVTGISTVDDSTVIEGFVRGTDELLKLAQLFGT